MWKFWGVGKWGIWLVENPGDGQLDGTWPNCTTTLSAEEEKGGSDEDSQCLVMAYVTDTPSRRLDSYIILTLADVGRRIDSFLFHTLAEGRPSRRTLPPKYMSNVKGVGQAANVHMCEERYIE